MIINRKAINKNHIINNENIQMYNDKQIIV